MPGRYVSVGWSKLCHNLPLGLLSIKLPVSSSLAVMLLFEVEEMLDDHRMLLLPSSTMRLPSAAMAREPEESETVPYTHIASVGAAWLEEAELEDPAIGDQGIADGERLLRCQVASCLRWWEELKGGKADEYCREED
ncbi:hypothetical protein IEQ34_010959 [Dendrobium chrysotoxum]|uniref:Uncharacterized protein n=1 Tax=Dendrobium chrysotoxum TaxID=161865 RepID=A0AAV7GW80_DENCH|nr:hypothetical protein IEQ34_010959 [Dendrobium chrysotoxum]